MSRKQILSFFIFITFNLFAQNGIKKIDIEKNYIWKTNSKFDKEMFYFNLPDIQKSNYKIYYRFNYYEKVIDIFSNDSVNFNGELLNKVIELKAIQPTKSGEFVSFTPKNYVFEIVKLDKKSSDLIGELMLKGKFIEMPSDKFIDNWVVNRTDCDKINFEMKNNSKFIETHYSCIDFQDDNIAYVTKLKKFMNTIDSLKLYNNKDFYNKLERGKTYSNEISTFYRNTIEEEKERNYQKSTKQIIDNFIVKELNKHIKSLENLNCSSQFYLDFNKKGELKEVTIHDSIDEEFYRCEKIIRKAFDKIKITKVVDPKYEFGRVLIFKNNEIIIE